MAPRKRKVLEEEKKENTKKVKTEPLEVSPDDSSVKVEDNVLMVKSNCS